MGFAATAVADGSTTQRGADTATLDTLYLQDSIETARALIGAVGADDGSGPIRGTHEYMGDQYAFRDNAAATACLMYKESTSGWVLQDQGNRLPYLDAGAGVEYVEGETITGTTSGASAVIKRVVRSISTYDWGEAGNYGYLIIGDVTGGPFQAEDTTGSIAGAIPITSAEAANTMAAGGRYEFANDNFFGSTRTQRMYGVNGVSEAFEWDGTVFVPIITGNVIDTPSHVAINEFHLQLVFPNGSLQNSATGTPYIWAGGGAQEIGVGHEMVGLVKEVGQVLIILCRERTFGLYGKNTTASPWDLRPITEESGGIEWTMQRLGKTRYLDDRGFMSLEAVQEFGDFSDSAYSQIIEPLVTAQKINAISSIIVKNKHQLRTFFSDGTAIIATFDNKQLAGFTAMVYQNDAGVSLPVLCTSNGEDSNGAEILFFGSNDGYLYQMDSGTSFDGSAVDATLVLSYTNQGLPAYDKNYKKVTIEADGSSGTTITYSTSYDYASGREPTGISQSKVIEAGGSYWDNAIWDEFSWAAEDITQIEGGLDGSARSISLQISSSSTYTVPHTLYAVTFHYIKRKLVR
jgi:hypothetical protein